MNARQDGPVGTGLPRGTVLLREPLLNKGTAYGAAERESPSQRGLPPPPINTQEAQVSRRDRRGFDIGQHGYPARGATLPLGRAGGT